MKIRTRFLILVSVLFIVTGAIAVALVNRQMRTQALSEAESKALAALGHNLAIHTYFSQQLKPRLFEWTDPICSKDYFEPTWMSSSYVIREINKYRESDVAAGYHYKECAINARIPENEADNYERDFLEELSKDPKLMVSSGQRTLQGEPYFVVLRQGEAMEESCLRCHGNPEQAPVGLVSYYGPERSFHRKVGDVVQAISIRVPLSVAFAEANRLSFGLSVMLLMMLMLLFGVVYWLSRRWVFQPLDHIREKAVVISNSSEHLGEEIPLPSGRELCDLTASFNRRSESLRRNRDELEHRIRERTADLEKATEGLRAEVAERKQAEEALRESEEKYRMLVENANVAIYIAQDGMIRFPNPMTIRMLGYSEQELSTHPLRDLIHPEDREMTLDRFERRLEAENVPDIYSFRMIRKDGKELWVQINAVRVIWEGRPASLSFVRNVTLQKKLEAQLHQSQRMESLGRLAGGLAHDLNNLMTVVTGYAEMLSMLFGEDEKTRSDLGEIRKAGKRAAALVTQLLAFSRKQVLKPQVIDLNRVVKESMGMLRPLIGEDIEVKTLLSGDLGRVKVDPAQMEQVLLNLVVNARDAMPGGGKLTIETANVTLDQAYALDHGVEIRVGPYVTISVSDTGTGMEESIRRHIFEPFFTTKKRGKGTGLGLSTVYGIVKQHEGYVWVYSEPGQGTTFKVYLPWVGEEAEGTPERKETPCVLGGSETVLVVEDEEAVLRLCRKILEGNGYRVFAAETKEDALKICTEAKVPIHLMLTDVVMPGKSGPQLAKEIQALQPDIKVLYMSGYTDNAIVHHGMLEEGVNFIEKPFTPEGLAGKVREVLDH